MEHSRFFLLYDNPDKIIPKHNKVNCYCENLEDFITQQFDFNNIRLKELKDD